MFIQNNNCFSKKKSYLGKQKMKKTIQLYNNNFSAIYQLLLLQKHNLKPFIDFEMARQVIQNSVDNYDHNLFFDEWKNYHLYSQIEQFNLTTNFTTTIFLYSIENHIYGNIETQNEILFILLEDILKYQFIPSTAGIKQEDSFKFEFHNGLFQLDNHFLEAKWGELIPTIAERTYKLSNKLYFSRKMKDLQGSDWTKIKLVNCIQNIQNDVSEKAQQEKHNIITEVTNRINQNITIKDLL